jgi:hypothetical protein
VLQSANNVVILQAARLADSRSTHVKVVVLTETRYEPIMKAFDRLIQLSGRPNTDIIMLLQYIPPGKMVSVAPDATALNRRPDPTLFVGIRWENHISEDLDYAQTAANSLTDIIAQGNVEAKEADLGYGTYGKIPLSRELFALKRRICVVNDPEIEGLLPGDRDGYAFSGRSEAYFGANYRGLQALKKKYDPDQTFTKGVVIEPA